MSDALTVRVYNVRFGDAILITVPDRDPQSGTTVKRRILIDVGNAPKGLGTGEGGDDAVFKPVVQSILDELNGAQLDLYVMTHEHLDHVQGLFYAATKLPELDLRNRFKVNSVWLTASSHPDYYDQHSDAKKKMCEYREMYRRLSSFLRLHAPAELRGLMDVAAINDPQRTAPCVDFLRDLPKARTTYVYRGVALDGTHPFREAKLTVWAPEEDTSEYYGTFHKLDEGLIPDETEEGTDLPAVTPVPPPGVDVGAFLRLLEARRSGIADNLLAIDKAANNTSVVFLLEWRGWRLLFAGDAEVRSWRTMEREEVLKSVHFLKVAHHGSHNGTPTEGAFEAILPAEPPDSRERISVVSAWTDTYPGIPHPPTDARLKSRTTLYSTLDDREALYFDVEFTDEPAAQARRVPPAGAAP